MIPPKVCAWCGKNFRKRVSETLHAFDCRLFCSEQCKDKSNAITEGRCVGKSKDNNRIVETVRHLRANV